MTVEFQALHDKLLEERARLEKEISEATAATRLGQYEERNSDDGSAASEKATAAALATKLEDMLQEVEQALKKFEQGTYGRCDRCGQDIPPERLQIWPQANLCVTCKAKAARFAGKV